ncbi:hypothetical protein [Catenulispora rubra]|uniref:hypothetical protein n=1 Tax=Catenulispora rubra TaxID=280293 RepID=UPI0018927603|nr:hypothetical protein [Catenulispora rubra]
MNTTALTHWAATAPAWQLVVAGVVALAVFGTAVWLAIRVRRFLSGYDLADLITAVVALAATTYAATGTWKYLTDAMHYGIDLKVFLVGVLEGAQVAEALRARKNIRETGTAGVDGVGLWVLTGISAALSTSVAGNFREALGRAVIPAVGAWLWERALAPQRRAARTRRTAGPIRWRITPERVFVWLRLADAIDTDVLTVDSARRVAKFLRLTDRERDGWRFPLTAKARAYRGRMKLIGDALRHGDPSEVHAKLSRAAFADALDRLGIAEAADDAAPAQTPETGPVGADGDFNSVTVESQAAPINTPVNTPGVDRSAAADSEPETPGETRVSTADADRIIRYGWETGMGVRATARAAERDPGQVSRRFAGLDKQFGARPRVEVGYDVPVMTGANSNPNGFNFAGEEAH